MLGKIHHLIVALGTQQVEKHVGYPAQHFAGVLHRFDGIGKRGGLRIGRDLVDSLPVNFHRFLESGFIMFDLDAVERRCFIGGGKRCEKRILFRRCIYYRHYTENY